MTGDVGLDWSGKELTGLVYIKGRLVYRILEKRGLGKSRNCKTWTSKNCELVKLNFSAV